MIGKIEEALHVARNSHQTRLSAFLSSEVSHEAKERMAEQILEFEGHYPGGLKSYTEKISSLMTEFVEGKTKYDDVMLKVPATVNLTWDELDLVRNSDQQGIPELKKCAFFLLAGGLGERLGYHGAKPCMSLDSVSHISFLQLYCEYILAYQDLFGKHRSKTRP